MLAGRRTATFAGRLARARNQASDGSLGPGDGSGPSRHAATVGEAGTAVAPWPPASPQRTTAAAERKTTSSSCSLLAQVPIVIATPVAPIISGVIQRPPCPFVPRERDRWPRPATSAESPRRPPPVAWEDPASRWAAGKLLEGPRRLP